MPSHTPPARTAHWLWPPLLLIGCITALIGWIVIALSSGSQSGWVALLSALSISGLLRLGTLPSGTLRMLLAGVSTVTLIVLANWGIAAAQIGMPLGLDVWSSLLRMGSGFAWTLSLMANHSFDWTCYVLATLLALWTSR